MLTFGLALIIEGCFRQAYGSSGQPYTIPPELQGARNLGFMFLPNYRAWVIVASLAVCLATWFVIERTRLGAYLRAATENPVLVQAFGIDVPRMVTLTYGGGVALAALAGVMAAPIYQVSPLMGSNIIIVVFAVVVIGGMGSILGAIVSGFALGADRRADQSVLPRGLEHDHLRDHGAGAAGQAGRPVRAHRMSAVSAANSGKAAPVAVWVWTAGLIALAVVAPFFLYPVFLMQALCMALFACAFNLLLGYVGLLSFGHAAFFGSAAYITAHAAKVWGLPPELAILAGVAAAAALGAVFGYLAIRRQGIYFAMITLAFAQMVYFFCLQAKFTGGEDGIQAVPRGHLFGFIDLNNTLAMYYFVLAVFLFGFWRDRAARSIRRSARS